MQKFNSISSRIAVIVAATALVTGSATAQYAVWFDGYNTSGNSLDVNFENALRQGGVPAPINYTANTADPANDFRHQLQAGSSPGALQLAQVASSTPVLVSPLYNFSGLWGGDILGRKVSLTLDANTVVQGAPYFTQAGITIGGSAPLLAANTSGGGFSVMFIQDTFGGNGDFIQVYDGNSLLANLVPNPAGAGPGNIELLANDLSDGNPWDGVGSTTIDVLVNNVSIGSFTKGGGGYTGNFITLEGSANFVGLNLATHGFDDLTVWAAAVPEPSSFALTVVGLAGWLVARRRNS